MYQWNVHRYWEHFYTSSIHKYCSIMQTNLLCTCMCTNVCSHMHPHTYILKANTLNSTKCSWLCVNNVKLLFSFLAFVFSLDCVFDWYFKLPWVPQRGKRWNKMLFIILIFFINHGLYAFRCLEGKVKISTTQATFLSRHLHIPHQLPVTYKVKYEGNQKFSGKPKRFWKNCHFSLKDSKQGCLPWSVLHAYWF